MTGKELLEIAILVIGGGAGAGAAGFSFATWHYQVKLGALENEIRSNSYDSTRKIQQNIDHILAKVGILECDVRDIKGVMIKQGTLHEREGFPQESIPKITGWTIEDA